MNYYVVPKLCEYLAENLRGKELTKDVIEYYTRKFFDEEMCVDCGEDVKNPGLPVCGSCYNRRIWG